MLRASEAPVGVPDESRSWTPPLSLRTPEVAVTPDDWRCCIGRTTYDRLSVFREGRAESDRLGVLRDDEDGEGLVHFAAASETNAKLAMTSERAKAVRLRMGDLPSV
jgi:hypothetical protein